MTASTVSIRRRRGIAPRVAGVETVDVGEEHEEIGVDEMGDEGGQVVVVADLDLVHRHRVVLVDHGQHAEVEQGEQGVARVQVPAAIADVLGGEEHLADLDAVALERLLVVPHERGLPDGRRGLLLRDRARPGREAEARRARDDGARGDERDLAVLGTSAAMSAASAEMRLASRPSPGLVIRPLPTLTTSRRARVSPRRAPMNGSPGCRRCRGQPGEAQPRDRGDGVKGSPCAAQKRFELARRRASVPGSSALLPATIWGRAASSFEYAASSPWITRQSSTGSRPEPTDRGRPGARARASARCGAGSGARVPCPRRRLR